MAANLLTTKMSSKGHVVIPESVRNQLGIQTGSQFVVLGHGDTVVLKLVQSPSAKEFEAALKRLRQQARSAGRTRRDVARVIDEVRVCR